MRKQTNQSYRLVGLLFALGMTVVLQVNSAGQGLSELRDRGRGEESPLIQPGIREVIPHKFKKRYDGWKSEFLSTETGRSQWENYARMSKFSLTITVTKDNPHEARVGEFAWDSSGALIAATITLGCRLDSGYPWTGYYPVTGTLAQLYLPTKILAATKIAHEFGHLNQDIVNDNHQRQRQLLPVYDKIFQSNGHDSRDSRLVELAQKLGGTPIQLWADQEYWAEARALLYLREKITKRNLPRSLLIRIAQNIEKNYAERFRLDPSLGIAKMRR